MSAAFWASTALADSNPLADTTTTSVTTSTALTPSDFTLVLQRQDGNDWVDLAKTDAQLYLNRARCECETKVRIAVRAPNASAKLATVTATGTEARLYVGDNCVQLNTFSQPYCLDSAKIGELTSISGLPGWAPETTVGAIFAAAGTPCTGNRSTQISLWVQTTGYSYPDKGLDGTNAPSLAIKLDGQPPAAPSGIKVEGGNEALQVSWTSQASNEPDLAGYAVFCMRGDGLVVFAPSFYNYGKQTPYQSSLSLCPTTAVITSVTSLTSSAAASTTTAQEVVAPAAFQNLDPAYLCSNRVAPTQASERIRILQNGIPYTVGVASIDTSGNISPIVSGFVQRPVPTVDFYHAYRDAGGESPGGYCSLGGGGHPGWLVWLAGTGLAALLAIRRRRRRRRGQGLLVLLALLAAPPAQAQVLSQPKDGDDLPVDRREGYHTPQHWAVELRFGPYAPNVDSEFSGTNHATPFKNVFGGGRHLMSQLEVDWQFFQTFGSLSVGAVVGYYSQSAKGFVADSATGLSTGERSGDSTSLRLIPVAALLVYRWDVAANLWKIPLVPYGKLGLNYTFWSVSDGNDNVPHYLGGRGSGGTPGWQAAAGISLRLDFIDPTAARMLDLETGVNHTYVFFEWNHVDATGLGMSHKLHVGDSRWVLGMMFEF